MNTNAFDFKAHILLSVAAALVVSAPSLTRAADRAEDRIAIRHQTVSYAKLDLTTDEGARTLYRRLKGASRSVCAPVERTIWLTDDYRTCVNDALGNAVHDINRASLTRLYIDDHTAAVAARYGIDPTVHVATIAVKP